MDKRLLKEVFNNKGPGKGRKEGDDYVITFADGKELRLPSKAKVRITEVTEITIEPQSKVTTKREVIVRGTRNIRPRKKRKENVVLSFIKSLFEEDK